MPHKNPEDAKRCKRIWYENNKERMYLLKRKRAEENKEEIAIYNKNWRAKNKEEQSSKRKQYRIDNKEKIAAQRKASRERNRDKIRARKREFRRHNTDKINEYFRDYMQKRRKNDPCFKAMGNMRRTFSRLCEGVKIGKTANKRFAEFFGCTEECFCNYIEMQFTPEMSWENWGTYWQLDHIIPISLCKGEKEIFKRLSHFTNLQPLIAFDNMSKADNIVPEYIRYDLYHRFKDLLPQDYKEPDFGLQWEEAILSSI